MGDFIFTVSQLNEYVKGIFSRDPILRGIYIKGEISNFKFHSSGHMYFSLKDEEAIIRCVMFRQHNRNLSFLPKNGMSVIVKGYISLYVRDGQYQCYVEEMKDDGLGELYIAFETMKRKLQEEGLFDPSLKKKLPFLPRKVGIVTSHTGAAIRDILQISIRRFPNMDLLIVPVRVQGEGAAAEIAWGIEFLNTRQDIDVIIVARGGGSVEELWAFNEECVARSIFQSKLPVVSAVGHETDFTIADFVADLRAPTPSAAAELVIPMKEDVKFTILQLQQRMILSIERQIALRRQQLKQLRESSALTRPQEKLDQRRQELDHLTKYLEMYMSRCLEKKRDAFRNHTERLNSLSPLAVLGRGYAVVGDWDTQRLIKSTRELKRGQRIYIQMQDGRAEAVVGGIYPQKELVEDEELE